MGDRLYAKTDEWVLVEGDTATVGVSEFAQSQLGDVVFLELPKAGTSVRAGETFGVIESVKAASDLYAPISGEVIEVNEEVRQKPELVNADAEGNGWLIKVRASDSPAGELMDAAAYKKNTEERAH